MTVVLFANFYGFWLAYSTGLVVVHLRVSGLLHDKLSALVHTICFYRNGLIKCQVLFTIE